MSLGLENYDSSDDEPVGNSSISKNGAESEQAQEPQTKRRKILPSLPSKYDTGKAPNDDPSLHQGRIRSRPFHWGEYNAHLYVTLTIPPSLQKAIDSLITFTRSQISKQYKLHSLLTQPTPTSSKSKNELHISLTHPLPLRRSQIDQFRVDIIDAVRRWSNRHCPNASTSTSTSTTGSNGFFRCSLSGKVSVYYNGLSISGGEGAGGRGFMALRVVAGSNEIKDIAQNAINPILNRMHLPKYHENPEHHTSFAWLLLDPNKFKSIPDRKLNDDVRNRNDPVDVHYGHNDDTREAVISPIENVHQDDGLLPETPSRNISPDVEGSNQKRPINSPFTSKLISRLNEEFEKKILECQPKLGWEVKSLSLRIGKEVYEIGL